MEGKLRSGCNTRENNNKFFLKEKGPGKLAQQVKMFAKEAWEPEFDFPEPMKE